MEAAVLRVGREGRFAGRDGLRGIESGERNQRRDASGIGAVGGQSVAVGGRILCEGRGGEENRADECATSVAILIRMPLSYRPFCALEGVPPVASIKPA